MKIEHEHEVKAAKKVEARRKTEQILRGRRSSKVAEEALRRARKC
jgi:hypothetical protein